MQSLLIAHMNALAGRADEFAEWYTYVHTRDVMRMRGSIAVQRFVRSVEQLSGSDPASFEFLTVYETANAAQLSQAHKDAAGTSRMVMTSAADYGRVSVHYYYPILFEDRDPAPSRDPRHVLHLQFGADEGSEAAVIGDVRRTVSALLEMPGALRAYAAVYRPKDQMFRRGPDFPLVALVHLDQPTDVIDLIRARLAPSTGLKTATIYDAATDRVTKDDVLAEGPDVLAIEEEVRDRARASPPKPWKPTNSS